MGAFARVFVFVERGAVEAGERPFVAREVCGHPVDDDADTGFVQRVDEELEIIGRPEATGGPEEAGDLVSPRGIEGVLSDGKKLNVSEAGLP
jgi:hypothetical protein